MPERIVKLSREVSETARKSLADIQSVTRTTRILSINALIEAARAGEAGKGFTIVAQEVGRVSTQIDDIASSLSDTLAAKLSKLDELGKTLVAQIRGSRLADLALNMIEIIDRNLYERSCDVRWWATDSAVVEAAAGPGAESGAYCSKRLGVILDSYTVYLDIWVLDSNGNVLATGRPEKFRGAREACMAREPWFKQAMQTRDGTEYAVADIAHMPVFSSSVATYATAIRAGGETHGKPIGALAVFFDWQAQSQSIVNGVRLSDEERERTRCLIIDSKRQVIAASDQRGVLKDVFPLETRGGNMGNYAAPGGAVIGYALTPGYETYEGLGWFGVIEQQPPAAAAGGAAQAVNGAGAGATNAARPLVLQNA